MAAPAASGAASATRRPTPFEHVLADQVAGRQLDRVLPVEAGPAEPGLRLLGRGDQAVAARRSPASRRRSSAGCRRCPARWRSARPGWRSRCRRSTATAPAARRSARAPRARPPRAASARCARWVLPRTIESSTTTSRLPRTFSPQRVELEPDAELADGLRGLDEGPPDVRRSSSGPAPYGDAGRLGVTDRGRGARLGHRDHQVGLDRVLLGQLPADLRPGPRTRCARRSWCPGGRGRRTRRGSPWAPARRTGWTAGPSSSIAISSPGSTSRTTLAPTMSSAAVSLATTQPRSSRPSTSGRTPCGSRAA